MRQRFRFLLVLISIALLLSVAAYAQTASTTPAKAQPTKPLAGYDVLVMQRIEVGSLAAGSGYPPGYEGILQKTAYSRLATSKLFKTVIDGAETSPANAPAPEMQKRILLSGTVIGYDKGSRTARWMVGMGAGKSRVKVRFIATDAGTGQELWRTDQEGTFAGTFELGGGSESKAVNESTRKVAENLVKQITLVR
jgi:hypothetical protein